MSGVLQATRCRPWERSSTTGGCRPALRPGLISHFSGVSPPPSSRPRERGKPSPRSPAEWGPSSAFSAPRSSVAAWGSGRVGGRRAVRLAHAHARCLCDLPATEPVPAAPCARKRGVQHPLSRATGHHRQGHSTHDLPAAVVTHDGSHRLRVHLVPRSPLNAANSRPWPRGPPPSPVMLGASGHLSSGGRTLTPAPMLWSREQGIWGPLARAPPVTPTPHNDLGSGHPAPLRDS